MRAFETGDIALAALLLDVEIIEMLRQKGIISTEEMRQIWRNTAAKNEEGASVNKAGIAALLKAVAPPSANL